MNSFCENISLFGDLSTNVQFSLQLNMAVDAYNSERVCTWNQKLCIHFFCFNK